MGNGKIDVYTEKSANLCAKRDDSTRAAISLISIHWR